MSIWFRLQPENDEPRRLLDPEHQRSERWEGTVYGRCDKWGGKGKPCMSASPAFRDERSPTAAKARAESTTRSATE
jgi:hypothetical protein